MKTEKEKTISIEEAITWYKHEKINFIPLRYKDKRPIGQWKEYMERKITDEEIDIFFKKSQHNIGVVCGFEISNGLFVLDFDDPQVFEKYFTNKEQQEKLCLVKTGRGFHVYFKSTVPIKPLKGFNDAGQEVFTVKSTGGYVVSPPSIHENGKQYEFVNGMIDIPILKGNIREDIKKRARSIGIDFGNAENEKIDIVSILAGVLEGARDTATTHLIHYLRRQGASYEEAFHILQLWNLQNSPPIPENELYEKVNYHYSLQEPYKYFYKTNPAQYVITSDLKLLPAVEVTPPMTIEDVFYEDAKGNEHIDTEKLVTFIELHYTFKCATDTQELLYYDNGIYVDELNRLDQFLQYHLFSKANIKFKAEIRKQVKDRNPIERHEINKDKIFMPVQNGLLNLNTHELKAFSKEKIYTSSLNVRYDAAATAPEFLKFLSEILPKEEIPVIQEMFGYTLWRGYPAAKSFWLIGNGGNGKTVLTSILHGLLNGINNVSHVALNEMDGQHRFAGYELYGKFANIVPEPTTTRALETPFLKAATGESPISVERKGVQRRVQFTNFAKVIIEANSVPRIADEKQALWDRIIAIEFPYVFRGRDNERHDISKELTTSNSLSGILNWALEGLERLRANNWSFSSSIQQEHIKVSMEIRSNPIAAFKDNWLSFSRHDETPVHSIYDAYNLFGALNGTESLHNVAISKGLLTDKRITTHRVRHDGHRDFVFRGCSVSSKIICAYGWHNKRPLKLGGFNDVLAGEKIEVRTCGLSDYCLQYPEPVEEIQDVIEGKLVIFNALELVSLYKKQLKAGTIKHRGPQEVVYEKDSDTEMQNAPKKEDAPLFIKPISPLEEGLCECCGKRGFLSHKLIDEEGTKSLICKACSTEIEKEIGALTPLVFNTTLDERRAALNESKAKKGR